MATYRCKQTGNLVVLTLPYDIKTMVGHQGYDLVPDAPVKVEPEPVKKLGRPRKVNTGE